MRSLALNFLWAFLFCASISQAFDAQLFISNPALTSIVENSLTHPSSPFIFPDTGGGMQFVELPNPVGPKSSLEVDVQIGKLDQTLTGKDGGAIVVDLSTKASRPSASDASKTAVDPDLAQGLVIRSSPSGNIQGIAVPSKTVLDIGDLTVNMPSLSIINDGLTYTFPLTAHVKDVHVTADAGAVTYVLDSTPVSQNGAPALSKTVGHWTIDPTKLHLDPDAKVDPLEIPGLVVTKDTQQALSQAILQELKQTLNDPSERSEVTGEIIAGLDKLSANVIVPVIETKTNPLLQELKTNALKKAGSGVVTDLVSLNDVNGITATLSMNLGCNALAPSKTISALKSQHDFATKVCGADLQDLFSYILRKMNGQIPVNGGTLLLGTSTGVDIRNGAIYLSDTAHFKLKPPEHLAYAAKTAGDALAVSDLVGILNNLDPEAHLTVKLTPSINQGKLELSFDKVTSIDDLSLSPWQATKAAFMTLTDQIGMASSDLRKWGGAENGAVIEALRAILFYKGWKNYQAAPSAKDPNVSVDFDLGDLGKGLATGYGKHVLITAIVKLLNMEIHLIGNKPKPAPTAAAERLKEAPSDPFLKIGIDLRPWIEEKILSQQATVKDGKPQSNGLLKFVDQIVNPSLTLTADGCIEIQADFGPVHEAAPVVP